MILGLMLVATLACRSADGERMIVLKKLGFETNPRTSVHQYILPWSRPMKPGFCDSWEWYTDEETREMRIKLCKDLSVDDKLDCDLKNGLCKDKCPYKNGSFPYWRIRNADAVNHLWVASTMQFFGSVSAKEPLTTDPSLAYASSYFGPGYHPSNAFDNNNQTLWVSNGASGPGLQWIGYAFNWPVTVQSVRVVAELAHPERLPTKMLVEGSCERYFKNFKSEWSIDNNDHLVDMRQSRPKKTTKAKKVKK